MGNLGFDISLPEAQEPKNESTNLDSSKDFKNVRSVLSKFANLSPQLPQAKPVNLNTYPKSKVSEVGRGNDNNLESELTSFKKEISKDSNILSDISKQSKNFENFSTLLQDDSKNQVSKISNSTNSLNDFQDLKPKIDRIEASNEVKSPEETNVQSLNSFSRFKPTEKDPYKVENTSFKDHSRWLSSLSTSFSNSYESGMENLGKFIHNNYDKATVDKDAERGFWNFKWTNIYTKPGEEKEYSWNSKQYAKELAKSKVISFEYDRLFKQTSKINTDTSKSNRVHWKHGLIGSNWKKAEEDLGSFLKKINSTLWKDLGGSLVDAGLEYAANWAKSLTSFLNAERKTSSDEDYKFNTIVFGKGIQPLNEPYKRILGSEIVGDSGKDDKNLFFQKNNLLGRKKFSTGELVDIAMRSRLDADELPGFTQLISFSPLLSQSQYNLYIRNVKDENIKRSVGDFFKDTELRKESWINFRLQDFTIPKYERPSSNSNYGVAALDLILSLQPTADHKTEISIICDKNLDEFAELLEITGNTIKLADDQDNVKYNLSAVSEAINTKNTEAILEIINGREIFKSLWMENLEWRLHAKGIPALPDNTLSKPPVLEYYALPVFYLSNFKFLDFSSDFTFKSDSANFLTFKATVSWTKMNIVWVVPRDEYYSELVPK